MLSKPVRSNASAESKKSSSQQLRRVWKANISQLKRSAVAKKSVKMDSKSNDDFRTIMEEAETGIFTTKKAFIPPAVSTKSLGTWEKHTKGVSISNLICIRCKIYCRAHFTRV